MPNTKPGPIEAEWQMFVEAQLKHWSPAQLAIARRMFFIGAITFYQVACTDDMDVKTIERIADEFMAFKEEVSGHGFH